MVEIVEVKTRKQLKTFATYPLKLFKDCPYYTPSIRGDEMSVMNPKKNFNLIHCDCKCFLAYKNGEVVGRIAAIIHNTANKTWNRKSIRFSRFDAIDDLEVFDALLNAVAEYGRSRGMNLIHGPWGFNDTDREGLLTYGFDKRSTYATNYHYPYFAENMKKLGWEDESKWIERDFVIPTEPYDRVIRIAEKLKTRLKVKEVIGTMSIKKVLKKYGDSFFETYNQSYSVLDEYVPVTGKERTNIIKQFATILNPRYVSFLVDENEECVAFAVVLPSICKPLIKHKGKLFPFGFIGVLHAINKPKELEMALIGIRREYKNSGINAILMMRLMNNIVADKIERIESNPMLESNVEIQQNWKFAVNEVIKKRQTYIKYL